jgi:hypothetical protein
MTEERVMNASAARLLCDDTNFCWMTSTDDPGVDMTVREAAHQLEISVWRAWQLCTVGVIPSWQAEGRILIDPEDVEAFAGTFAQAS